jgi:hypothetical protein
MKLTFPMPHRQHCEAANAGRGIDCYCMIYGKTVLRRQGVREARVGATTIVWPACWYPTETYAQMLETVSQATGERWWKRDTLAYALYRRLRRRIASDGPCAKACHEIIVAVLDLILKRNDGECGGPVFRARGAVRALHAMDWGMVAGQCVKRLAPEMGHKAATEFVRMLWAQCCAHCGKVRSPVDKRWWLHIKYAERGVTACSTAHRDLILRQEGERKCLVQAQQQLATVKRYLRTVSPPVSSLPTEGSRTAKSSRRL